MNIHSHNLKPAIRFASTQATGKASGPFEQDAYIYSRNSVDSFKKNRMDLKEEIALKSRQNSTKLADSVKCGLLVTGMTSVFGLLPAPNPLLIFAPIMGLISAVLTYLIKR